MNTIARTDSGPWYQQPWPWLLMLGPAVVIVAGSLTAAFAIETFDGLVAEDYYKQGTAINATLRRDQTAATLGYQAAMAIDSQGGRMEVSFLAAAPTANELTLTLSHASRPGADRLIVLTRNADGRYIAALPKLEAESWQLNLDDSAKQWRLTGHWQTGESQARLAAAKP